MELDNIIYIVITISIFIISLLGQFKRKKTPPAPVVKDEVIYSLNDFEKILERKEEYRISEEQNSDNAEIINEQDDTQNSLHEDNQGKPSNHQVQKDENDDGFDIKSAIIYSSILERKKFRH